MSSIPRRLARPQREGQVRYFVEQINHPWGSDEKKHIREPGYLGALRREFIEAGGPYDSKRARLAISVDQAVADKNGDLRWEYQGIHSGTKHDGLLDLADARALCDELNKKAK